ncbi:MAG: hypothetical protein ACXWRA_03720 [Pseudobdellovibrionaceae bacterium]
MLRFTKLMTLLGLLVVPFFSRAADNNFLEEAELKCVAEGVEVATGPGGEIGLHPSEKYLALLGFAVQRNYKGVNSSKGGSERVLYLQRVIQFLQAYGFCVAYKLDGGGAATTDVGYGDVVHSKSDSFYNDLFRAVSGLGTIELKDGNTQSPLTTNQMKGVINYFGFLKEDYITKLFFNDNLSSMTPKARQKFFSENIENIISNGIHDNENGNGLKDCFTQIKQMQKKDTLFNFNNTTNSRRDDNDKFCATVAKRCNLDISFCSSSTPTNSTSNGSGGGRSIFDSLKGRK